LRSSAENGHRRERRTSGQGTEGDLRGSRCTSARHRSPHGGDGEVCGQQLARAEGRLRERDGAVLQGTGCRRTAVDEAFLRGQQAEYIAGIPATGFRVRRLLPAKRRTRVDV